MLLAHHHFPVPVIAGDQLKSDCLESDIRPRLLVWNVGYGILERHVDVACVHVKIRMMGHLVSVSAERTPS